MSDQIHYRLLSEGEIIQEGDEYYESTEWLKSDQVGGRIGRVSKPVRRPYTPFQWIPVEESFPSLEDSDNYGFVFGWGLSGAGHFFREDFKTHGSNLVAWAKIPPYIPAASPEEKEFEVWYSQNSSEPTNSPAWKLAKDAWMAAKKGGKA